MAESTKAVPFGEGVEQISGEELHPIPSGTFTIQNERTGSHRTLRVRLKRMKNGPPKRVLELLTGSDNVSDFTPFAFVAEDRERPGFVVWKAHRSAERPSVGFFNGFAPWSKKLSAHQKIAEMLAVLLLRGTHPFFDFLRLSVSKRCMKCNRALTDPESIRLGIGPVCRGDA